MKTCTKCKEIKSLEEFHIRSDSKSGRRSACKSCRKKVARKYYQENPEKVKRKVRKWQKENLKRENKRKREYHRKNPEKGRGRARKWAQENPEKRAASNAKYHARKRQATPHWLTEEDRKYIKFLYRKARDLTESIGILHEVDHIHPLQGENICGLHVPENLQILTAEENLRKSNSH